MSAGRYRVRVTLQSEAVERWAAHEGYRGGMPDTGRLGPLVHFDARPEHVTGKPQARAEWEVRTIAPNARRAINAAVDELEGVVPRMHALLEQHDGNTLIEAERLD